VVCLGTAVPPLPLYTNVVCLGTAVLPLPLYTNVVCLGTAVPFLSLTPGFEISFTCLFKSHVCFCLAATSIAGSKIPKDMCIGDGLFEDPADCRNYYWCQVNSILLLEVNSLVQF